MDARHRNAIARIEIIQAGAGVGRGTGFLVGDGLVLTALHVVADRRSDRLKPYDGEIRLSFPSRTPIVAQVHEDLWDRRADWILLVTDPLPDVQPLPLAELGVSDVTWITYGFPDA